MVGEDEKTREMVDAIVKSGDTVQNILIRLQKLAEEYHIGKQISIHSEQRHVGEGSNKNPNRHAARGDGL